MNIATNESSVAKKATTREELEGYVKKCGTQFVFCRADPEHRRYVQDIGQWLIEKSDYIVTDGNIFDDGAHNDLGRVVENPNYTVLGNATCSRDIKSIEIPIARLPQLKGLYDPDEMLELPVSKRLYLLRRN